MRVVFLYMGAENLGVQYLSSVLKKNGHETFMVFDPALFNDKYWLTVNSLSKFFDQKKEVIDKVVSLNPDLVAFSVFTDCYKWASFIAKGVKQKLPNVPTIFGGIHPTSVPEEVIMEDFVDYVGIGEGEDSLLEFVNKLGKGEDVRHIPGIWAKDTNNGLIYKNPIRVLSDDIDSIPFPDKEMFNPHLPIKNGYMVAASRGCPYSCTFCSNNLYNKIYRGNGKWLRRRTTENIISELKEMKAKYNFDKVDFVDDIFTCHRDWLKEFLITYKKEINLPFKCITHPHFMNDEIAQQLKEADCYAVALGVQSTNESYKLKVLKRYESNDKVKEATLALKKAGLSVILQHIVGLPDETGQDLIDAAKFYIDLKPTRIETYTLAYFPATEIVDIALERGQIDNEILKSINTGGENMYFDGGSLREVKKQKQAKSFSHLLSMVTFLPRSISRFFVKTGMWKYFYIIPNSAITLAEVGIIIATREHRAINYMKYYFKASASLLTKMLKKPAHIATGLNK